MTFVALRLSAEVQERVDRAIRRAQACVALDLALDEPLSDDVVARVLADVEQRAARALTSRSTATTTFPAVGFASRRTSSRRLGRGLVDLADERASIARVIPADFPYDDVALANMNAWHNPALWPPEDRS